jgi:hypothetical protein
LLLHYSFFFSSFFLMIFYCCFIVQWGPWQSYTTEPVILTCGSQIVHHLFGPIVKYLHSQVHFCIYMLYIESRETKKKNLEKRKEIEWRKKLHNDKKFQCYKRIWSFSHIKLWFILHVWDKPCGFFCYNIQDVIFTMA